MGIRMQHTTSIELQRYYYDTHDIYSMTFAEKNNSMSTYVQVSMVSRAGREV